MFWSKYSTYAPINVNLAPPPPPQGWPKDFCWRKVCLSESPHCYELKLLESSTKSTIFIICNHVRMVSKCQKELLLSESPVCSDGPMSESWGWQGVSLPPSGIHFDMCITGKNIITSKQMPPKVHQFKY